MPAPSNDAPPPVAPLNGSAPIAPVNGVSRGQGLEPTTKEPRKLILCFDGTGNSFTGSNADTNVVKLLNKLDRNHPNQFHYYQTGIGTYDVNEKSVNKSWYGEMRSSVSKTIDEGFGTTFDAHVMAGYRFLMRYYDSGGKIYMFGFSRGAFTAKFLARMISTVGLLCKGNEELVPFAYRLYQRYLAGEIEDFEAAHPTKHGQHGPEDHHDHGLTMEPSTLCEEEGHEHEHKIHRGYRSMMARNEIAAFSTTFCRKEETVVNGEAKDRDIKVYFLGMWDCVSSVAVLEKKAPVPVPVKGTAQHVRHAVAVDERRVKFKAALLAQDVRDSTSKQEDVREVWFPGCHGDVGGGWPAVAENPLDSNKHMTLWQRVKNFWTTRKAKGATKDVGTDPFQMSDIPLAWMMRELELVGEKEPAAAVKWTIRAKGFKHRFQKKKDQALRAPVHDSLTFGRGTGFFTVLLWKFMEWLPIITRWELEGNDWVNVRFPLNGGDTRDIPCDAVLHESLLWRLHNDPHYHPTNNHGGRLPPCLKHKGCIANVETVKVEQEEEDPDHQTYKFGKADV